MINPDTLQQTVQTDLIFSATRFFGLLEEAGLTPGTDEYRLFLPALSAGLFGREDAARVDKTLRLLLPPSVDGKVVAQALAIGRLVGQVTLLFNHLRRVADLPLGVDDYLLVLRALQKGYGRSTPQDPDALKRLCNVTWANSTVEQAIINAHFDQLITASMLPLLPDQNEPTPAAIPQADEEEKEPEKPQAEPLLPEPVPQPLQGQAARPLTPTRTPIPAAIPGDMALDAAPALLTPVQDHEVALQRYLLVNEYLPITRRQMKQSWRYLRRPRREGPLVEVDVEATVRQISQDGFFLTPTLRPRRVNKAGLLILLDQDGSMAPFHVLSRRLRETAVEAGKLGRADIYYFHDCPPPQTAVRPTRTNPLREHLLFTHEQLRDARPTSEIMADFQGLETGVLIFSDAGAARGSWDEARIEFTAIFLYQLKALGVEHIAWVNPMPEADWPNSSAAAIAALLPMFSMDRNGLYQAIDVLRGRTRRTFTL